jgi:hypothetical protein
VATLGRKLCSTERTLSRLAKEIENPMGVKLVVMRCSACKATKKIKPNEVPGPGKCLPCHECLGIMDVWKEEEE